MTMLLGANGQRLHLSDGNGDAFGRYLLGYLCVGSDGVQLLDQVGFTARAGEILGIAGIAGSGQRELLEAIAGLQPITDGQILYEDPKSGET